MNLPRLVLNQPLRSASVAHTEEPQRSDQSLHMLSERVLPQDCGCSVSSKKAPCASCAAQDAGLPEQYVYLIGSVEARFPSLSVEKEFYQAVSPDDLSKPLDKLLFPVLSQRENLYIARELCWSFSPFGTTAYVLLPRGENELLQMIGSLAPGAPGDASFDVIIGRRGPIAAPSLCNGMRLPVVLCDHVLTFTYKEATRTILQALQQWNPRLIPVLEHVTNLLDITLPLLRNTGDTDASRALNFLLTRYAPVYLTLWDMLYNRGRISLHTETGQPYDFQGMRIVPSDVQGQGRVMDVIFSFHGLTELNNVSFYTSVDVRGEMPYGVTDMVRYYHIA